jgi:hypothetical protein
VEQGRDPGTEKELVFLYLNVSSIWHVFFFFYLTRLGDSGGKGWSSVCNAQFCSELPWVGYWWHHQKTADTNWICPSNANKVSHWLEVCV